MQGRIESSYAELDLHAGVPCRVNDGQAVVVGEEGEYQPALKDLLKDPFK